MPSEQSQAQQFLEGADADFLSFLCVPEQVQQHTGQNQFRDNSSFLAPMRVPPMPRAMLPNPVPSSQQETQSTSGIDGNYSLEERKRKFGMEFTGDLTAQQKIERRLSTNICFVDINNL